MKPGIGAAEAAAAMEQMAAALRTKRRKMVSIPTDAPDGMLQMFHALKELAARGCSHLTPPSTCRQKIAGEPRERWCEGCIAAEGLGLDPEWFQLR